MKTFTTDKGSNDKEAAAPGDPPEEEDAEAHIWNHCSIT